MRVMRNNGLREVLNDDLAWRRVRRAFDDGCSNRDVAARFGLGVEVAGVLRRSATADEAREAVVALNEQRRAKDARRSGR